MCVWVGGRDSLVCGEGRAQTHRMGRAELGTGGVTSEVTVDQSRSVVCTKQAKHPQGHAQNA